MKIFKKNKFILLFIYSFYAATSVFAQDINDKKTIKKIAATADTFIRTANKALKNGDIIEAEKLYEQALKVYPVINLSNDLPLKKIEIGDVKGANNTWDRIIKQMESYSDIYSWYLVETYSSKQIIRSVRLLKMESNYYKGDIQVAFQEMIILKNEGHLQPSILDYGAYQMGEISLQVGEYNITQQVIEELTEFYKSRNNKSIASGQSTQVMPIYLASKLALAKGDFNNALQFASQVVENDKSINKQWKAQANLINAQAELGLGNIEKSKSYLNLAIKSFLFKEDTPQVAFVDGLIALAEKDYQKALERFNTNLSFKSGYLKVGWVEFQYLTYTKKAEAYLSLNDYTNARKSYETALIYYENYQPAINGLANLEVAQIAVRKNDKAGPEIKILEPTNMRGLIVVSGENNIMVKGLANDASGLKEVIINGIKVYAKEDGNFWGSVALKEGVNKIVIVATDLAGNKTEQSFEIEKTNDVVTPSDLNVHEKKGKNYAVFIASQNYDDSSIPSLEKPISDAIKLKLILKNNYNFSDDNFFTLFNPEREDFKKKFIELREVIQPEDNLIIFYAGHGIWVEKEKKGYWLLTDAKRNDVNTWLPNKQVLEMIAELPSRNTLLITDACFSGSVFKTRSIGDDAPASIKQMQNKICRVAITSGNDTEVPDESVFMKHLIKALSENKEKYLTAQKMFVTQIIEAVMTESKTEPRYGTLELAGHVGGDYIFNKK